MKNFTRLTFILALFLVFSLKLQSQVFNFTISQSQQCFNGINTATAAVTATAAAATSYSWSTLSNTCNSGYTLTVPNGSVSFHSFSCAGNYTIFCYAMNGGTVLATVSQTVAINPLPVISASVLTGGGLGCSGSVYTLTASGALTYTWAGGPPISGGTFTALTSGCYTVLGTNASGCVNTTLACYSVQPNPTLTVIGPNSICTGVTATLVAAGASTYTWNPGNLNGPAIVVSPTANSCYTVTGTNPSGCASSVIKCITISVNPTVNVNSNPSSGVSCLGNTFTLSASGATSYTWTPTLLNGATILVTPTVNMCYTVSATIASGCVGSSAICLTVNPNPLVTVAPTATVCPNTLVVLSASGALTYSWTNGSPFASISVSPSSSTCYTVTGSNANGCTGSAVACVTVAPPPAISIAASTPSVCMGSSACFTASGAASYTWSTIGFPTTNTICIISTTSSPFILASVSGVSFLGCVGSASLAISASTACADVWPGDANNDGVVNNSDVFEIGLAFNATGSARSFTSNAYNSQYASTWSGIVSTGKNKCHADCNGDGTINNADTLAIFNNFSLTHPFKSSSTTSANSDISIIAPATVYAGQWNKADILLGTMVSPVSQLYGVAFDVNIDQSLLDNNSAYLVYTSSFLNAGNQNVQFRKNDIANGKIYAASVRVDGMNVNGDGKIGELWFKINPAATNNAVLNLSLSNSLKIGSTGIGAVLSSGSASTSVSTSPVKVIENSLFEHNLSFYPNPANSQITLRNDLGVGVNYSIIDVLGRELLKGEFTQSKTLDVSGMANGAYFIKFETAKQFIYKKLVIEK